MARDLRPPTLDQLGLVAALSSLMDDIEDQSQLVAELRIIGSETRLDSEIELGSFRIIQEAIRNTLRHSEASFLSVTVTFGSDELTLNVEDNGSGFEPESPSERDSEHLGLLGMRERSRLLGGRLEVHSVLGRGTSVVATLPLNAHQSRDEVHS